MKNNNNKRTGENPAGNGSEEPDDAFCADVWVFLNPKK